MFVNSIGNQKSNHSFKAGINPETARNQMKIMLSQDCWAHKLKVRKPESALEKEVLLEILKNRLQLDRFTRLTNELFRTKASIILYNALFEKEPKSPECEELGKELDRKGNLISYLNTLDKQIELEKRKNKQALDYFNNIDEVKDVYLAKKLVKDGKLWRFYDNIVKNNINKDEQYSTQELIDIIEASDVNENNETKQIVHSPKILSKKQLLTSAELLYEDILRKTVNIYEEISSHFKEAKIARAEVEETYKESIIKYPEVKKALTKIYENIEKKIIHKVDRIADLDIYPIGVIWKDMAGVEAQIKSVTGKIDILKHSLSQNSSDKNLMEELDEQEKIFNELKEEWINGMLYSVKYEKYNRERMIEAGNEAEYTYLADKNPTILKHNEAAKIYHENNDIMPEEFWKTIIE